MVHRRSPKLLFGMLLLASASLMTAPAVATELEDRRAVAISLAREGRCATAVPELAALEASLPRDASVAQLHGECAIRLQQFGTAAEALERARQIDWETPRVDVHLAIAYFHLGDLDRAEQAISRAETIDAEAPDFLLYAGMIALARADYENAVGRLGAASALRDRSVEPMASFYLGRAFGQTQDQTRAESAFQSVIDNAPDTVWAQEAQRAIDRIHDEGGIQLWAAAELGYEFDDNALLRGRGVGRPSEISNQSDHRGFWFVDLGATFFQTDAWTGAGALRYGGSEHHELDDFDAHSTGGSLWVDRALGVGDATLRLQGDFDATWIDNSAFLFSHLWSGLIHKPWSTGAYTIATVAVGIDDYRYDIVVPQAEPTTPTGSCAIGITSCGPFGLDELNARDRDGTSATLTLLHRELIPIDSEWLGRPWIEGQYRYSRYTSEGSEYDHQRHQVEVGVGTMLPFELQLTVSGRYAFAPYRTSSTFPNPNNETGNNIPYVLSTNARRDRETGIRVRLERAFGEHVVVSTRYSRTRNRSNADSFDYTRDLFGLSVRVALGG